MGRVAVPVAVRRPSARAARGIAVILGVAWILLSVARWLSRDRGPNVASDLDVPRLFPQSTELRYEDLRKSARGGVPVLCYHYFREGLTTERILRVLGAVLLNMPTLPDRDYWSIPLPEFERQMRWLHENGYRTITLDELADWLDGTAPRPERAVALTFDDGDESFVRFAAPVLRRYGFRGTVFFLTGRAGARDWNDLDLVTWDALRALEREGLIRVESHTHDMHTKVRRSGEVVPLFLLSYRDAAGRPERTSPLGRDLLASREAIRRELGHDTRFLAWPFGFGEADVDSLAHSLGFRRILTLSPKRNRRDFREMWSDRAPDGLGRYAVTARTSFRLFRLMVEGGTLPAGPGA
jgi:peptidoglycan/xylan/chitin deacetylase (PgdA/CDA1 family)